MFTCEQNVNRIILKTVTFLLLLMRNNVAFALPAVFIMEAKCHKVHIYSFKSLMLTKAAFT